MAQNYIPAIEYGDDDTTIEFAYPPVGFDSLGLNVRADQRVSTSSNGTEQTQTNYIEEKFTVTLSFLSTALKDAVDTFMKDHALFGREFTYYVHGLAEPTSAMIVTLSREGRAYSFEKIAPEELYRVTLRMRRVV